MNTPTPPPEGNGFSDSDQQWFDRLSGKPGAATSARAIQEADALKLALKLEQEALDADPELAESVSDEAHQRQWEQLQFRLKREGLLQSPERPWWRQWPAVAGLAAMLMVTASLLPMWRGATDPDYPEAPTMRGEPNREQVAASRPREAAEAFATSLRQAGFEPAIYRAGSAYLVDIDIRPERLMAAAPAFERVALKPRPGLSRVEFK